MNMKEKQGSSKGLSHSKCKSMHINVFNMDILSTHCKEQIKALLESVGVSPLSAFPLSSLSSTNVLVVQSLPKSFWSLLLASSLKSLILLNMIFNMVAEVLLIREG